MRCTESNAAADQNSLWRDRVNEHRKELREVVDDHIPLRIVGRDVGSWRPKAFFERRSADQPFDAVAMERAGTGKAIASGAARQV